MHVISSASYYSIYVVFSKFHPCKYLSNTLTNIHTFTKNISQSYRVLSSFVLFYSNSILICSFFSFLLLTYFHHPLVPFSMLSIAHIREKYKIETRKIGNEAEKNRTENKDEK